MRRGLYPDLAVALINVSILIGTGQGRFWFNNLIRRYRKMIPSNTTLPADVTGKYKNKQFVGTAVSREEDFLGSVFVVNLDQASAKSLGEESIKVGADGLDLAGKTDETSDDMMPMILKFARLLVNHVELPEASEYEKARTLDIVGIVQYYNNWIKPWPQLQTRGSATYALETSMENLVTHQNVCHVERAARVLESVLGGMAWSKIKTTEVIDIIDKAKLEIALRTRYSWLADRMN